MSDTQVATEQETFLFKLTRLDSLSAAKKEYIIKAVSKDAALYEMNQRFPLEENFSCVPKT